MGEDEKRKIVMHKLLASHFDDFSKTVTSNPLLCKVKPRNIPPIPAPATAIFSGYWDFTGAIDSIFTAKLRTVRIEEGDESPRRKVEAMAAKIKA